MSLPKLNEGISIDRHRIEIKNGMHVRYRKDTYRITSVISLSEAVGVNISTNRPKRLEIEHIKPIIENGELDARLSKDESEISDEYWQIALERFKLIQPFIESSSRTQIEELAKEHQVHYTTIYTWLKSYREAKSISALVPNKRGWKPKKSRLPQKVESLINEVINSYYLTTQKPTVSKVIELINAKCYKAGIDAPHANSVRNRIKSISPYKRMRSRGQEDLARDKLKPATQEFPGADYPLAYVQIDHTKLDITIVDEEHRLSIGRPWITLAIDVFSRTITGYYLSLDAPSTTSVAMCTTMSILPKNQKLLELDIDANWDIWGLMNTLHSDNGADFRTYDLQKACLKYGVHWEYRPIGGKEYGGHIERLIGSLNKELHSLPGTTFSNIVQRGSYDSDGNATLTFAELERWIVTWITKIYHQKMHSELRMSPMQKWEEGIWGTLTMPGTGLKAKPSDPTILVIDFLPEFPRTIQRDGVSIDSLQYYADALRVWIGAKEPDGKTPRKFIFKRDPRDISYIWFYEPEVRQYFKVPTAKQEIPPVSWWEYKAVKEHILKMNKKPSNQHAIYEAIYELRQQVEDAGKITKQTRRQNTRKKLHKKTALTNQLEMPTSKVTVPPPLEDDLWSMPIEEFDDIR